MDKNELTIAITGLIFTSFAAVLGYWSTAAGAIGGFTTLWVLYRRNRASQ